MVKGDHSPRISHRILGVLVVTATLAGCAQQAPPAPGQLSLADTKAAAQLFRNQTASRVPAAYFSEVVEPLDVSIACGQDGPDPTGMMRSWVSSTTLLIKESTAQRINALAAELAQSYVDEGWKLSETATPGRFISTLTNEEVPVSIELRVEPLTDAQEPSIRIEATGSCVMTGGPASDEVAELEK